MTTEAPSRNGALVVPDVPLAKKATLTDARVKVFAWGEPGTGKSRLGLSFPKPLVVDLEKSTELYAGEFDFLVAKPTKDLKPHQLVYAIVQQINKGLYDGQVETLVIDPITDYIDALEGALIDRLAARGVNIAALSGLNKSKAYAEINDGIRAELDKILALPLHVVFVCRAKNLWGKNADGKMDVIGRQPDCKDIVPYLADLVLKMERDGTAIVEKGRLGALASRIPAVGYKDIQAALTAAEKKPQAATAQPAKAKPGKTAPSPAACATCNGTQAITVDDGQGGSYPEPCPACVPAP